MRTKQHALVAAVVVSVLVVCCTGATFDCGKAPAKAGDRRTDTGELVVTSFNVEWLFDGVSGPSSVPWKNKEEADEHTKDVAVFVRTMDPMPDVLLLQEVQDCDMLRALIAAIGDDAYKPYLIKGTDTATQQNTGMITKVDPVVDLYRTDAKAAYPMAGNTCGDKVYDGTQGVSKHLLTEIAVSGKRIGIMDVHFLAFPTLADRCAKREAQATVARAAVDKFLDAGIEAIVLGDCNDYSDAVPDSANDVPTSRVIRILRDGLLDARPTGANATAAAKPVSLVEVSALISHSDRYTSFYSGSLYSQIDHLLVSPGLAASIAYAKIDHRFPPGTVSDHWPLTVVIKT